MFNLSLQAQPFSPSEVRHLPEEDRPVFMLRPAMSGEIMDARSAAHVEADKPEDQGTHCPGCGHAFTVPVIRRVQGEIDNGKFGHALVASVITEVRNLAIDGEPAEYPEGVASRVAFVRRLPPSWVAEMATHGQDDADLDPEEE